MIEQTFTLGGGATAAAPGSSCILNPELFSLKWGDSVYERENAQKMHYIRMPQAQWEEGVAGHLEAHPHNYAVRQWIGRMAEQRAEYARQTSQRSSVETPDSDEVTFRVWKDMIEEPWKYGDDIVEWLELDAQVCAGPKRWRAAAFWQTKEDEHIAKEWQRVRGLLAREAAAQQARLVAVADMLATRIQAAWRGYSTRVKQTWRDCAHCLVHEICVEQVEGKHVCRCCYGEANPVEDDVVTPLDEDMDLST